MTSRTKSTLLAFAVFGLAMGIYSALATRSLLLGLVLGVIAGAGFAVFIWIFRIVVQRSRRFGMKNVTGWADDEAIIRSGPANMFRHGLAEGGMLFLTNTRVRFRTHRASAEVGDYSFPVAHISSVQPCRTLGVVPNGIEVNMSDGRSNRFVVEDRAEWLRVIDQQRVLARPPAAGRA
jgi:hypothetical protein